MKDNNITLPDDEVSLDILDTLHVYDIPYTHPDFPGSKKVNDKCHLTNPEKQSVLSLAESSAREAYFEYTKTYFVTDEETELFMKHFIKIFREKLGIYDTL